MSRPTSSLPPKLDDYANIARNAAELQLDALTRAQAIVHFDPSGTICDANGVFLAMLGYELHEIVGRHHSMFVPLEEADTEAYESFWEALRRGVHQTATFKRLGKGGREIWIRASYIPVLDSEGRPGRVVKYAVDVTDERFENANFRGQIEAIQRAFAVVEFELDGTITAANDPFLRLLGYERDELVGTHHCRLVPAEQRCREEYEYFWRQLRRGVQQTGVFERIAQDGTSRFIRAAYSPILDLDGRTLKVIEYATDVTRQKNAEAELESAKESALSASAAKSLFLATMSHEIRTPMNGVIAAADLLRKGDLGPRERELAEVIYGSGQTLLALMNDLLDFSKLEARRLRVFPEPTDVRALLEEVVRSFDIQRKERNLRLELEVSECVPSALLVDGVRLRQVLVNLCSNALKFTHRGGVRVHCRSVPGSPALLEISVRDTGIGMADTSFLFEYFSQEESARTREYGGTGLGLAICRRLTELMGGRIWAESEWGEGSTFTFHIQAPAAQEAVLTEQPPPSDIPGGRALVVDDNFTNRLIAERVLRQLGWSAESVDGAEVAIERIATERFDVVFMDCEMPGMSGFEATAAIRRMGEEYHSLPIVALTASTAAEAQRQCLDAGMNRLLTKPIRAEQLAPMLASLTSPQRTLENLVCETTRA